MNQPSSRHLSHDYPAWKGLSLRELFWIVMTTTPAATMFFILVGALIGFPIALGCRGFVLGFILSITVWPKLIARLKTGKPHGHVLKKTLLLMVRLGLKHSPWTHYQGRWNKNKTVGG